MKRKLMTVAWLTLLSLGIQASPRDGKPTFELKKHEVSFSGSIIPGKWFAGYDFNFLPEHDLLHSNSLTNNYFDASVYEIEKTTLAWSLNYAYNFNRFIAVGATLSYEGGSRAYYTHSDDNLVNKENKNYLTTLAFFRASWLNRPYVRMYSLIGAGASYSMEGDYSYPIEHLAFQFSPLCISFGKALYGHVELGIGTLYMGANIGIGYRF